MSMPPPVVVIDESLAEKYFPGQDPIGQYLNLNTDPSERDKVPNPQIVGVVGHVNQWGLDSDAANPLACANVSSHLRKFPTST